jgi:Protein of unknown function (DUF4242)
MPSALFLVERYLPLADLASVAALRVRLVEAAEALRAEGHDVTWVQSVAVPADEACLCLFRAGNRRLVAEANTRAGVDYERITEAVSAGVL